MNEMIVNAENAVAGRTASLAAKALLQGKRVHIVNAEKAMINGEPSYTIALFRQRLVRGDPYKGPFFPRSPDRMLKRIVRGMLPYKKPLGRKAFQSLRVHLSVPEELEGKELVKPPGTVHQKALSLQELSKKLKG